ncbi:hypothetical protein OSB04_018598 [Centaurea solstitialis]|uniref:non-specific serine/threonine protein kinase n=1 Tax=Centaurea solstitialis TaxID=347529 RepID=A0AA38TCQ0_9ASTR|nr:hypothetical protein OSB04_018598 [Centaurea solstitialis]
MTTPWILISSFWFLIYSAIALSVYPSANLSTTWIAHPNASNSMPSIYDSSIFIPVLTKDMNQQGQYFVCGFFCNGTCTSYIFSIFIIPYEWLFFRPSPVIWSANEDHPIKEGATLNLTAAGELVLQDVDGTKVWTTNTTGKSVAGMKLTHTGNLVLFDAHNSVVWQSFDHPKDCLLPGQMLLEGQKLISSVSSTNWTKGQYFLQVTHEGLFAYIESNPPQLYYRIFEIDFASNRLHLRFLNGDFSLFSTSKRLEYFGLPRSSLAQYIKLMPDGHLQLFQWQDGWRSVDLITSADCLYPLACGRNAVCSANQQCSCPGIDYFIPLNNRQPNLGCSEITPVTCNATQDQDFILLENIDYSTFTANLEMVSIEACKRECLNNCSCKAALFRYYPNAMSGNCSLPSDLFTLTSVDSGQLSYNVSAFIKVQNVTSPQTPRRKTRVATVLRPTIASIVVLMVVVSGVIKFILHKQKRNAEMEEEYLDQGPAQVKKSFLAEVESIGSIHHVNLVTLKGFCALKSQPLLVYEFMSNGSLDQWIYHGHREHVLEWACRKKIILHIAKGLAYLHEECRQKIIHLDIKPQNILLDCDFNAKIADFGLSKLVDRNQTQVMTNRGGTPGYLAPEWLSSVVTEKVDVYSYGIVLLEVLCGRKNFDISQPEESRHLLALFQTSLEEGKLLDIIDNHSEDMQAHGQEVVEMMNVASWCLQADFTRRPSMSSVVKVFEGVTQVESNLNYSFIDPRTTVSDEIVLTQLPHSLLSEPSTYGTPFPDHLPFDYPTANLSTTWTNNESAPHSVNFTDGSTVRAILLRGTFGHKFACGFFCNGTCTSYLFAIFIVQTNSVSYIVAPAIAFPQVVWSANRDYPVGIGATLNLTAAGELVLRDADGSTVWTTNTTGKSVVGMNLTDVGNLVLFDADGKVVWQSFDYPTDSLVLGQRLFQGQKLIPSVSSTNWTTQKGMYSLQVTREDLLASVESNPPQIYNGLVTGANPNKERSYVRFLNGSLSYFIVSTEPSQPDRFIPIPQGSSVQYMRLMPDGHLKVFDWQNGWIVLDDVLTGILGDCGYPLACGRNALCSGNQQCSCPISTSPRREYFRPINDLQPELGCSEITPISCNSTQDHDFIAMTNVEYVTFASDMKTVDTEACKQACMNNCSCKAAIFHYGSNSSSGDCYLPSELFTITSIDPDVIHYNSSAFLKVQNVRPPPPSTSQGPGRLPKRTNRVATVLGSTIGSIVLLLFVVIGFVMLIIRKRKMKAEMEEEYLDQVPGMPTRFSYEELKTATEDFCKKLGQGGFGSVYEGTLKDGSKIAVKCLEGLAQVKKSFLAEVESIGSIHHVNLVRLRGFCAWKSQRLLVYEFMSNGSLDQWIYQGDRKHVLEWECRKKVVHDIAKGLAYLHEDCRQKIIHLDIKPQNILLDSDFNAKVSDFGLSKLIDRNQAEVITTMRGTPGYLAPEWKNFDRSQPEESWHLLGVFQKGWEQGNLLDMVDKYSDDMQAHGAEVVEMMKVASWCLQNDFTKRPSMSSVVKVLEGVMTVESNLDYNFSHPSTQKTSIGHEKDFTPLLPSVLSGPR